MNILSTTFEYKGSIYKVADGSLYTRAFGTTIHNHSMHWSWVRVTPKQGGELYNFLLKNNLIDSLNIKRG